MTDGDVRLPAYLVKGDDPVLRGEAARELVHQLVGEGDPSLIVEDIEADAGGDEAAANVVAAIVDAAQTPPFLGDNRVVLVRDVGSLSTKVLGPLTTYLASPLDTTSIVFVAGGGRVSDTLVKAVKKVGHVIEAGAPTRARDRAAWLDEHLKSAPVRLEPPARQLVDAHLGEDLGRLRNLLEALAAAYGSGSRVSADDVRPFLGEAGTAPPWELTDAIDTGDTATALAVLHRMLRAGERHALQVMASLHGHYSRILRLEGAGVADERAAADVLGIKGSTFPAKKALGQARRLGGSGVAEAFALLHGADLDLRGASDWPDELVLEVLVARLSRLGPRTGRARR